MTRPLRAVLLLMGLAAGGLGACAQIIGADFDVHLADAGTSTTTGTGGQGGQSGHGGQGGGDGGTTCADEHCVEVIADHLVFPWDITVRDGFVYWTVQGNATDGAVMRRAVSGGENTTLANGLRQPNRIAVTADHVWWTCYLTNGGVLRAPLAGGPPELFASGPNGALGLLIDGTNVYWTADGVVKKRALADGPGPGAQLSQNQYTAPGILVSDGSYLYFGEYIDPGNVIRLDLATGADTVLALDQHNPDGMALTGTGYLVFTSDVQDGSLQYVDVSQGTPQPVKDHQSQPTTVALSGSYAYWPSFGDGTVNRVLWGTGGSVTTIASNQASPNGIAVDDTYVYWTNYDPNGAVMRAKK